MKESAVSPKVKESAVSPKVNESAENGLETISSESPGVAIIPDIGAVEFPTD